MWQSVPIFSQTLLFLFSGYCAIVQGITSQNAVIFIITNTTNTLSSLWFYIQIITSKSQTEDKISWLGHSVVLNRPSTKMSLSTLLFHYSYLSLLHHNICRTLNFIIIQESTLCMVTGTAFSEPCCKVKKYPATVLLHIVVFFSGTP
jgi:hypothetical protein